MSKKIYGIPVGTPMNPAKIDPAVSEDKIANSVASYMANHPITPSVIGARPDSWMPTAEEVGARPNTWLPTIAEIGAAPSGYGLGTVNPVATQDDCVENGFYNPNGKPQTTVYKLNDNFIYQVERTTNNFGLQNIRTRQRHNGEWKPWEYVNPAMEVGYEYRTTERSGGHPVYVQVVDIKTLPSSSLKFVYPTVTIPPGAGLVDMRGIIYNNSGYRTELSIQPNLNVTINSGDGMYRLDITTTSDLSNLQGWVMLKYIKE